jgi:hypothetical protein
LYDSGELGEIMKKKKKARHFDNLMKLIRINDYEEIVMSYVTTYVESEIDGKKVGEYDYNEMKALLKKDDQ